MKRTVQSIAYASLIASVISVAAWGMGALSTQSIAWAVVAFIMLLWYRTKDSVFRTIALPVLIIACAGYSFPKVFVHPNAIETLEYLPPAILVTSIVAIAASLVRLATSRKALR
jgi:hypothetical protein